jgi:imidazole glycerol-phosphate synthase subunit HisF
MLRKRIIFTLIYSDGFFMLSRNFRLQKVGDLSWLERNYKFQEIAFSIDELIILDSTKNKKSINAFSNTIKELVKDIFIPLSAGGGIRSLDDAQLLFNSGADKIVLNSILTQDSNLVTELVNKYGSQSIVASVDYKKNGNVYDVFINNGENLINMALEEYLDYLQNLKVGEIYLNSIDKDGTGFGYDFEVINLLNSDLSIPVIIAGGAGNENHFLEGLKNDNISAVATANLYNFMGDSLPNARMKLLNQNINIARFK